mgnify:CR=1 FL=1
MKFADKIIMSGLYGVLTSKLFYKFYTELVYVHKKNNNFWKKNISKILEVLSSRELCFGYCLLFYAFV